MARIYYYSDDNELMEVEVGSMAPEVVIGRHSTCQIRSAGQSVSRRHARVYLTTGGYWIEDLGSSNGTFVSGERLEPNTPTSLVHETLFACGQFELRLTYDDEDFDLESAGWPDGTATARSALPHMPGVIPPPPPNIPPPPGYVPPPPPAIPAPPANIPPPPAPVGRAVGNTDSVLNAWLDPDAGEDDDSETLAQLVAPEPEAAFQAAEPEQPVSAPVPAPAPAPAPVPAPAPAPAPVPAPAPAPVPAPVFHNEPEPDSDSAPFPTLDEPAPAPSQLTRPATPSAFVSGQQGADLASLQAQLVDAREQLAGERLARRLAEQDMETAEQKAASLAQDKAKLTQEVLALQEQLATLTADATTLQVALDDANAALVDWQTAVDQWQAQCVAHEATIAALQAQEGQ